MSGPPFRGGRAGRRIVLATVVCWSLLAASALAVGWTVGLGPGSSGQAQSVSLPTAPQSVTATCGAATTVTVSWNAVAGATGYTVYVSTTSASSGYTTAATGVTGTSWTSAALTAGNRWFEVAATVGGNWVGANSNATPRRTISGNTCS